MSIATREILIAVVGVSPAILSETIWALAHESPSIIPDEVIVITTLQGKKGIEEKLIQSAVFEDLRAVVLNKFSQSKSKLRFGSCSSIQVLGDGNRDFEDIKTPEENEYAANSILKVIRQYTEDPSTTVIASIAGGRKTMSALMLACMSLLGREQDRVCHVLASDEYIAANPCFYYPRNEEEEDKASIRLSDIPFIRIRGWYQQESGENPASYSHMVSLFRSSSPKAIVYPEVTVNFLHQKICIEKHEYALPGSEIMAVWAFWSTRVNGLFPDGKDLADMVANFQIDSLKNSEDFSKRLNAVKRKLKKNHPELIRQLFPGIRSKTFMYHNICFIGCPKISEM